MSMVFIIGTGRCGSSFVHEVIAKHENVGFVSNIEDNFSILNKYGRWNNAFYRSPLGNYTKKGRLRFAPSEAYNIISKEVSEIYANSDRDLRESDVTPYLSGRFLSFFDKRIKAQNKPVFTHKYTGWSRIGFFKSMFPDAKFINIVRDGRAVANSWLQMNWWGGYQGPKKWLWRDLTAEEYAQWQDYNYSYPFLAGIAWKILMEAFHDAEKALSTDNYLKLRYEDILQEPETNFKKIADFCSLDWTDEFNKKFNKQKIKPGRSRAFERDLTAAQLSEIEAPISDLLALYHYK